MKGGTLCVNRSRGVLAITNEDVLRKQFHEVGNQRMSVTAKHGRRVAGKSNLDPIATTMGLPSTTLLHGVLRKFA